MKNKIHVGLLGCGTVGSGTAMILMENQDILTKRAGTQVELVRVCDRNARSSHHFPVPASILTDQVSDILDDPNIDIFVELIGGIEPARTFVLEAIEKGKHVVTANKALLATCGHEIFEAASKKGVAIGFEASVGGGIPVIKAVREGLVANNIQTVMGIMNGTANYILSRMTEEGITFSQALKEAQAKGYAEADPTYDVEGIDTGHKLAIMATLAFGVPVGLDDISIEGISRITPIDISFAKELGYRIKLLAVAQKRDKGLELRVNPTMVPTDHLLAQVKDAYNAFYFVGDAVGKVMLHGLGAGQMPTGSAVVADIVDLARDIANGMTGRIYPLGIPFAEMNSLVKCPVEALSGKFYFRFSAIDRPGVLARIAGILSEYGISIASVVQKGRGQEASVPIVMLTHEAQEIKVKQALEEIDDLDVVTDPTMVIRIEDLSDLDQ